MKSKPIIQYLYSFGRGKAEGDGSMKSELGGKGAGLAEMTLAGLPVPPGFTIADPGLPRISARGRAPPRSSTNRRRWHSSAWKQMQRQKLGAGGDPLLVSVRSGARESMPGMMDTILNLGPQRPLGRGAGANAPDNPRFAYDSYRRLIQMFAEVVMEVPKSRVRRDLRTPRRNSARPAKIPTLDAAALQELGEEFKQIGTEDARRRFPRTRLCSY